MGNFDEFICPLAHVLSPQLSDPILSNDIMNVGTRSYDTGPLKIVGDQFVEQFEITWLINGTIFDCPFEVIEGKAMIGFPNPSLPIPAPRIKSTCPPNPDKKRVPAESATTWPVKSTSTAELIAVTFGF
jgi:hypothetical protein